jgi:hypothetical protein
VDQLVDDLGKARRLSYLLMGDACQLLDLDGDRAAGIDQAGPAIQNLGLDGAFIDRGAKANGANLRNGITPGVETRGFEVQGHVRSIHEDSVLGEGQ